MKKVINRKMYNTETAIEIASYENMANRRDYGHFEETLYMKKTGEFFLYGCGGAASKYAEVQADRMRSYGEAIFPITENEARLWVEKYSDADTYIETFGEVEE